jgi:hypothetical protein
MCQKNIPQDDDSLPDDDGTEYFDLLFRKKDTEYDKYGPTQTDYLFRIYNPNDVFRLFHENVVLSRTIKNTVLWNLFPRKEGLIQIPKQVFPISKVRRKIKKTAKKRPVYIYPRPSGTARRRIRHYHYRWRDGLQAV